MKCTFISSLAATLLASATCMQITYAHAGEMRHPQYLSKFERQFNAADKDGDGALTRQEAEAAGMRHILESFDRIDANKDGKVTQEEIRAMILSRLSS